MLTVDHVSVMGFEAALRGMRNPYDSWERSDTVFVNGMPDKIGPNDRDLMQRLIRAGSEHRKFLRMVHVQMDVTAPLYWWPEFDAYKIGITRDSCSKMHTLLKKPFEMKDFSFEMLPGYKKEVKYFRPDVDEKNEIWLPCALNEEYEVSDQGRLRRNGKVLSGVVHRDGYIFTCIKGRIIPLHRIIAATFLANPDNKPEVNHKDGNKQNNRVDNLEWVTRSENSIHAIRTGLQPHPCRTYQGKFTDEEREEIKKIYSLGESKRAIAKKYNVSHTCINDIIKGKYKYIKGENVYKGIAVPLVNKLNELRDAYIECEDKAEKKEIWYAILQLLPEGYNQKSTLDFNYENALSIIRQREGHKLTEWATFREHLKDLPMMDLVLEAVNKA